MKGLAIHNFKSGQVWRHLYLGTHYKLAVGTDDLWKLLSMSNYPRDTWLPISATTALAAFGGAHDEFALVERSPIEQSGTAFVKVALARKREDRAKAARGALLGIKARLESALEDAARLSELLDGEYGEMGK
jgi:hypothetical protein